MATILDGINQMTEEELRLQLALFENVTITNVMKETGYRVVGGIRDLANALTEAFGSKKQFVYDVKTVADTVREAQMQLKVKSREELKLLLKKQIFQILRELRGGNIEEHLPEERLNKIIIDEAAKAFSIEKYKTMGNKTDEIIIEYNNAFLKTLHNQLTKETAVQKAATDKRLQQRLNAVSIEVKRNLQQRVMPKEFHGGGIGRVLRSERGIQKLQDVWTFLGREAFSHEEAEVWTIMAIRELKRPTRMQLARFVWVVGQQYGKKYAVSRDLLPSYIPADQEKETSEKEKEFRVLMQQRSSIEREWKKSMDNLQRQEALQEKQKEQMDAHRAVFDELHLEFTKLESEKDAYMAGRRGEEETKAYYASVNETKRRLDRAQQDYERSRRRLHEQAEKTAAAKQEKEALEQEKRNIEAIGQEQVEERVGKLRGLWQAYYYKFTFSPEVFEPVVIEYSLEERWSIESKLKELHEALQPDNLMDEAMEEGCRGYIEVSQGRIAAIQWKDREIIKIDRKE